MNVIQKIAESLAIWQTQGEPYWQVLHEAGIETLRRFRTVAMVCVPMHAMLVWLFAVYTPPAARPELAQWAALHLEANQFAFVGVFILGYLSHRVVRQQLRHIKLVILLQITIGLSYLYFSAYVTINDLVFEGGAGLACYFTVFIMFGVMALTPPVISIPVFASIYLIFVNMLGQAPTNPTHSLSLYLYAALGPILAMTASWLSWEQYLKSAMLRRELKHHNDVLTQQKQQLEFLANHDVLTGLYTRREFLRIGQMELLKASRMPCETAVIMIDLDYFKKINDRYGHPGGDAVLKAAAASFTQALRDTDILARFGGEEFIVLMPHTGQDGALQVAAKLRDAVRNTTIAFDGASIQVTASFGVSSLLADQKASLETLYTAADAALYQAKRLGRDRVEYAAPGASVLQAEG